MCDNRNLKVVGGILIGVVALGVSLLSVNALKDIIIEKKN